MIGTFLCRAQGRSRMFICILSRLVKGDTTLHLVLEEIHRPAAFVELFLVPPDDLGGEQILARLAKNLFFHQGTVYASSEFQLRRNTLGQ